MKKTDLTAPLVHRINPRLNQPAGALGPVHSTGNESRLFEHPQVLGDSRLRHLERLRQFHDRGFTLGQPCENCPACRVGKGREGCIEIRHYIYQYYLI